MTKSNDLKDHFYKGLNGHIAKILRTDKLIVFGIFNAKVGLDDIAWIGIIVNYNLNGLCLLHLCLCPDNIT